MTYTSENLAFSLELPDGWHKEAHVIPLTFTSDAGHIQIQVGSLLPEYATPSAREAYLMEDGCTVRDGIALGGETNTACVRNDKRDEAIVSAARDGLLYNITYDHASNPTVERAVDTLLRSFRFPTPVKARQILEKMQRDPTSRALSALRRSDSPESARRRLAEAGMPTSVTREGYTVHSVPNRQSSDARPSHTRLAIAIVLIACLALLVWLVV
jgi:hypothetical protein